jgi:transposase
MTTTTTRVTESSAPTINATTAINLLLAFELGERTWKLGFTTGFGQRPRLRQVPTGAVDRLLEDVARAKRRLRLADDTPVISCYEAGREGFWLHRYLVAHGITNHVVDSSSIEMNRRARRARRVVRVPTVAEEDARQLHRSWAACSKIARG